MKLPIKMQRLHVRPAAALLLCTGCAGQSQCERSSSTIGADLRAAPPGRSIPAAGLGVDLVRFVPPAS